MRHGAAMSPEDLNLDFSNLHPEPTPYGGWDEDSTHSHWMQCAREAIEFRRKNGLIPNEPTAT